MYADLRAGINYNFAFPSLTHYALSQSSNANDLLTVITQLKADGKIKRIQAKIEELTKTTKQASKFQGEVERLIKESFSKPAFTDNSWSIQISVLFISLAKNFNLNFFNHSEPLLFLKDIINCRMETMSLHNSIERVFKRNIVLA